MIQGEKAVTVDELPLEWFFSDGVILDITHKADGDPMDVADIEKKIGSHELPVETS